jgi:sugar lactone lactonase YvrE
MRTTMITMTMLLALAAGCGDDDTSSAAPTTTSSSVTGGAGGDGGTGAAGGGGAGGGGGSAPALELLHAFDPAASELPEGVAVNGDTAYAGLALLGSVKAVSVEGGPAADYAQVQGLPVQNAFATGLLFDAEDRLYVAVPSFVADPVAGVYRAPAGGGTATLFATDPGMAFPSDLGFDAAGRLYVTDSATATVFRVAGDGTVEVFLQDMLLAGDKTICGNDQALFDIGANGLVVTADALFVANTDQATIVRIPIENDLAGAPEVFAGPDCAALGGIDGLTQAADGTFYAALNRQGTIVTVGSTGTVTVALTDPLLDFPASVRLGSAGGNDALFITSFALEHALAGEPAAPALLRWTLP